MPDGKTPSPILATPLPLRPSILNRELLLNTQIFILPHFFSRGTVCYYLCVSVGKGT